MKMYIFIDYGCKNQVKDLKLFENREVVNTWIRESYNACVRKCVAQGTHPACSLEENAKMIWADNIRYEEVLNLSKVMADAREDEMQYTK